MRDRSFLPRRQFDLRAQRAHMRARWPEFECRLGSGLLVCTGPVQPSSLSTQYLVRIRLREKGLPRIHVVSPKLETREIDGVIPHGYSDGGLCMYHPTEWRSDRLIALTVVPWTYRWLDVYENWRVTGDWDAIGIHVQPTKQPA